MERPVALSVAAYLWLVAVRCLAAPSNDSTTLESTVPATEAATTPSGHRCYVTDPNVVPGTFHIELCEYGCRVSRSVTGDRLFACLDAPVAKTNACGTSASDAWHCCEWDLCNAACLHTDGGGGVSRIVVQPCTAAGNRSHWCLQLSVAAATGRSPGGGRSSSGGGAPLRRTIHNVRDVVLVPWWAMVDQPVPPANTTAGCLSADTWTGRAADDRDLVDSMSDEQLRQQCDKRWRTAHDSYGDTVHYKCFHCCRLPVTTTRDPHATTTTMPTSTSGITRWTPSGATDTQSPTVTAETSIVHSTTTTDGHSTANSTAISTIPTTDRTTITTSSGTTDSSSVTTTSTTTNTTTTTSTTATRSSSVSSPSSATTPPVPPATSVSTTTSTAPSTVTTVTRPSSTRSSTVDTTSATASPPSSAGSTTASSATGVVLTAVAPSAGDKIHCARWRCDYDGDHSCHTMHNFDVTPCTGTKCIQGVMDNGTMYADCSDAIGRGETSWCDKTGFQCYRSCTGTSNTTKRPCNSPDTQQFTIVCPNIDLTTTNMKWTVDQLDDQTTSERCAPETAQLCVTTFTYLSSGGSSQRGGCFGTQFAQSAVSAKCGGGPLNEQHYVAGELHTVRICCTGEHAMKCRFDSSNVTHAHGGDGGTRRAHWPLVAVAALLARRLAA